MKGCVYRLFCKEPEVLDCYIGSTIRDIKDRMFEHKYSVNCVTHEKYNLKKYRFIRSHGGWENWDHDVLESLDVESTEELRMREQNWIVQTPTATLNGVPAWRSEEENKEKRREQNATWYEANREKKLEQKAKYREANREKIREQHSKYREANREKRREQHSKYREEVLLVKVECSLCGATICRGNMSAHQKRGICLNNRPESRC
jgi:hypothetical protein